jgi:glycosyltransferase involved in cell wall biosynthesis
MFDGYNWWARRRDEYGGMPVYRVPLFLRRRGRGWQLALNYLSFVVFGSLLGPWFLRKEPFDVIFVFEPSPFTVGIPAALIRRLKKAPVIFWVQDLWPESLESAGAVSSPAVLNTLGRLVRWIYHRCDHVLVQSRGFIEPAIAAGAHRDRISYFPNWAEDFYQPVQLEKDAAERLEMPDGFCLMFAGNLGEAQSLQTILDAAVLLRHRKEIHWVMIGEGRRRSWLETQVRDQGLQDRFHFLGRRPAEQMPRYFSLANVLLVTLKDDPVFSLTIPSKVQSYLACGRPIIAALNGEGAKIVSDSGAGISVPAGNARDLADAAEQLHALPKEDLDAMGERGRAFFEHEFAADRLLNSLENWMQEAKEEGLCDY